MKSKIIKIIGRLLGFEISEHHSKHCNEIVLTKWHGTLRHGRMKYEK